MNIFDNKKGDERMIENFSASNELKFKELTPEEKEARGILGRLYGPIASIIRATRNGRKYTQSLWEKVFEAPIVKELFAQGGIPGELDHPTDRDETCSEKIAIMMPEPPTKNNDGQLIGYFDIIDTPCGRIAYALAKYGFHLGISSRGTGDTYQDYTGDEVVDEDTYTFNAFDLVLLPACKDARLQLVESYDIKKKQFKEAIEEEMNSADETSKKIIKEALENLNLDGVSTLENESVEEESLTNPLQENVASNAGADSMLKELQEALMKNKELQKQVLDLQESLSVSYTKEMKLSEKVNKLDVSVKMLTKSASLVEGLKSQVNDLSSQLSDKEQEVKKQRSQAESYRTKLSEIQKASNVLKESYTSKNNELASLERKVSSLTEKVESLKTFHNTEKKKLSEQISELKVESEINYKKYSEKLSNNIKLVEKYKNIASQSVDKYINCKAELLGVPANEIKSRLSENYTFSDIDSICESLKTYKRNISKLPFNYSMDNISGMTLKEDKASSKFSNPDDVIDIGLLQNLN